MLNADNPSPPNKRAPRPPTRRGRAKTLEPPPGEPVPNLYAIEMRERCKPVECTASIRCWVAHGGGSYLTRAAAGAARCAACDGIIVWQNWQHPGSWMREHELTAPKIIE